jgi:hypothetical protein
VNVLSKIPQRLFSPSTSGAEIDVMDEIRIDDLRDRVRELL